MGTAIDLSKYIVAKCIDDRCPITILQLQKMLYYLQRDSLRRHKVAFSDDIEAWQFGPVVPNVYYYYCGYGAMPITGNYRTEPDFFQTNSMDLQTIDGIVREKRLLKPWEMVCETQKPNRAWYRIYQDGRGNRQIIPLDLIRKLG